MGLFHSQELARKRLLSALLLPSARRRSSFRDQVRQRALGEPWEVMLTDLHCAALVGSSCSEEASLTGLHGTPEYSAPEVIIWYWHECEPRQLVEPPPAYGVMADVWSLGICLHVMLCGCFPFETDAAESAAPHSNQYELLAPHSNRYEPLAQMAPGLLNSSRSTPPNVNKHLIRRDVQEVCATV